MLSQVFGATLVAILPTIAFATALPSAENARICDRRDTIVSGLAAKYGEVVQSLGLDSGGNLIEMFASEQGSWTALLTTPRGQSCIVAAGEGYEQSVKVNRPPEI